MTRINLVKPEWLNIPHLIAEYREIMRLPNNIRKSLERKIPFQTSEIPPHYVLGKGHVKFFYNKLEFLRARFEALVAEMKRRGFNPNYTDSSIFEVKTPWEQITYRPSLSDVIKNIKRIETRKHDSREKG